MRPAVVFAVFAVSALLPLLVMWLRRRRWGLPVLVRVDPDDLRPDAVCGYLAEIARRLDERPERMRVVFDGRNREGRAITLDLAQDRTLRIAVEGRRAARADLRARWIADHPTPLSLRRAVLYIDPVDANRFRVMSAPPFDVLICVYLACSAVATAGLVYLIPEPVAMAVGVAAGCAAAGATGRG